VQRVRARREVRLAELDRGEVSRESNGGDERSSNFFSAERRVDLRVGEDAPGSCAPRAASWSSRAADRRARPGSSARRDDRDLDRDGRRPGGESVQTAAAGSQTPAAPGDRKEHLLEEVRGA
jgi:hypothetical protein